MWKITFNLRGKNKLAIIWFAYYILVNIEYAKAEKKGEIGR